MQLSIEDARVSGAVVLERVRSGIPVALLGLLLVLVALQRGGYYAESWTLPTIACGWVIVLVALLGDRQRLRRLEVCQLTALGLFGLLTVVSATWTSGGLGSALPPAQLIALDLTALVAVLLLFRRATPLVVTLWASLLAVAVIGLGARLFPSTASFDPSSQNRLYEPLGYWNSLGLWAAMGLCVSLVLVARARSLPLRALVAAGSVPFAVTLYFTFSRGAWVALVIGLVVAIALDPRRLGLLAWLCLLAPWPAAAVLLASRSYALTTLQPVLADSQVAGRKLALAVLMLAWIAALATALLGHIEQRVSVSAKARRAFAVAMVSLCLIGVAAGIARFGAPWTIAEHARERFDATPAVQTQNLNSRLFDANGSFRAEIWRTAWDDAREHPVTGSGAGSFAAEWAKQRRDAVDVTNAHELYLETLAELGPLGLALLLTALGVPLVAAWRARRHPLAAGVTAAYVAFIVHLGVDWDWQLAAVGLAGLSCGAALLVMARGRVTRSARLLPVERGALAALGLVIATFALWSLQGTNDLGQARDAADDGNWVAAEGHAADAVAHVGGFSAVAWQLLGESQTALRRPEAARVSLRMAVKRDPESWEAWYDLANVTTGDEHREAARKAFALNPLAPETQALAGVAAVTPPSP